MASLLVASCAVYALITSQTILPSTGIIIIAPPPPPPKTIGLKVFSDEACTVEVTSINWGNLSPGSVVNRTIYLMNTGNTDGILTMSPAHWNPLEAQNYITLTWDKEDTGLAAGWIIKANLVLAVDKSISGITTFNFDIVLTIEGG